MWGLFNKKKQENEKEILIKKIKEEKLDMGSLFSSINNRSKMDNLYKELCKLTHPDLYENDAEKQKIANEIFTQIQNSRNDYDRLVELKDIITEKLIKG